MGDARIVGERAVGRDDGLRPCAPAAAAAGCDKARVKRTDAFAAPE